MAKLTSNQSEVRRRWLLYWGLHMGLRRQLVWGSMLAISASLVLIPIPLLLKRIIDTAVPHGDVAEVLLIGLGITLLSILGAGLTLWSRHFLLHVTKTATSRLRKRLLRHTHQLPYHFFTQQETGQLHATIVSDTGRLDSAGGAFLSEAMPSLAGAVGFTIVVLMIDPLLFLMVLLGYLPVLLLTRWLSRRFRAHHHAWRESHNAFSAGVTSSLKLLPLYRAAGIQEQDIAAREADVDTVSDRHMRLGFFATASRAAHLTMMRAGSLLVLTVGCVFILMERMEAGTLVAFFGSMLLLNGFVQSLLNSLPVVVGADDTLESIQRYLDHEAEVEHEGGRKEPIEGGIEIRDLCFSYGEDRETLSHITLKVRPGELAAIVGPSGGGKTTLLMALLGIHHAASGEILFDGVPIDEFNLPALRRQIGVVSQNTLLISGTIAENIRLEKPDATMAEITAAAMAAQLHDFIESLPDGYETHVGEDGIKLSGGQRQRLSLARALVRQPQILLLDEPTHGLDPVAAREAMAALHGLHGQRTILLVTHDLELVRRADCIHLIDNGVVVGRGTAAQLEESNDLFRRLCGAGVGVGTT